MRGAGWLPYCLSYLGYGWITASSWCYLVTFWSFWFEDRFVTDIGEEVDYGAYSWVKKEDLVADFIEFGSTVFITIFHQSKFVKYFLMGFESCLSVQTDHFPLAGILSFGEGTKWEVGWHNCKVSE